MSTIENSEWNVQENFIKCVPMKEPENLAPNDWRLVGRRITFLRTAKGLKQNTFAVAIGTTAQKLNNYEKGRHELPTGLAIQVCTVTGADFDYIYRGKMDRLPDDILEKIVKLTTATPKKAPRRAKGRPGTA